MTIYFVRHGESVNNVERKYQGADVKLSEEGHKQAEFIANRLNDLPIEVILSSTYVRTKQTAEAIQKATGAKLELLDSLIERKRPSLFNDKPYDDPTIDEIRELIDASTDPDFHHSDEENFFDVKKRAEAVIKYLETRAEDNIVVVSHGVFIKTILLSMMLQGSFTLENFETSFHVFSMNNTALSIAKFRDGKWKIYTINDFAHLAE